MNDDYIPEENTTGEEDDRIIPVEELESINRQRWLEDKIALHGRYCRCRYCMEYYLESEDDFHFKTTPTEE